MLEASTEVIYLLASDFQCVQKHAFWDTTDRDTDKSK